MADEYIDSQRKIVNFPAGGRPLNYGGGGGTSGGMEARIKALEDKFEQIDTKLEGIRGDFAYLKGRLEVLPTAETVGEMKGRLESMPTAATIGELKGRVDSLPTTAKIAAFLAIAVGFLTIVTKWSELVATLGFSR